MPDSKLRVAGVIRESVVDGPGIRYTVFVQGCHHECPGCHNPQTHDPEGGELVDVETIAGELDGNPLLTGVTFSGGEPFEQAGPLAILAGEVKERGLSLMVYSGYTYEQLVSMAEQDLDVAHLLQTADELVDGPFVLAERDLTLPFMGSRNQRFIDLARTRAQGRVILADTGWDTEIKY